MCDVQQVVMARTRAARGDLLCSGRGMALECMILSLDGHSSGPDKAIGKSHDPVTGSPGPGPNLEGHHLQRQT
jgi:hypothetical protein